MSWKKFKTFTYFPSISNTHSVSIVILRINLKEMAPVIGSKERVMSSSLVSSKMDANSCNGSVSRPHLQHESGRDLLLRVKQVFNQ